MYQPIESSPKRETILDNEEGKTQWLSVTSPCSLWFKKSKTTECTEFTEKSQSLIQTSFKKLTIIFDSVSLQPSSSNSVTLYFQTIYFLPSKCYFLVRDGAK